MGIIAHRFSVLFVVLGDVRRFQPRVVSVHFPLQFSQLLHHTRRLRRLLGLAQVLYRLQQLQCRVNIFITSAFLILIVRKASVLNKTNSTCKIAVPNPVSNKSCCETSRKGVALYWFDTAGRPVYGCSMVPGDSPANDIAPTVICAPRLVMMAVCCCLASRFWLL